MKLKICGIRTSEMLESCIQNNIDFFGFNFIPGSKRKISPKKCNQLILPSPRGEGLGMRGSFKTIALFMNQPLEDLHKILQQCPTDIIQLHGDETPEYINNLKAWSRDHAFNSQLIWKAFRITPDFNIKILKEYKNVVDAFLFDGSNPGSGKTADFKILKKSIQESEKINIPYGIAGGINPDNIQIFRNNFPKALFLDVASGVEKEGLFSESKLLKLID